ncbi:MAG: ribosome biogenesis GTP-binding protein YihA/YsxC [Pseudomonadales bacterium]|nr:ribosome biogenesis GTP-binding protein YihA/YsxC [Pseudomonadales bacterium]
MSNKPSALPLNEAAFIKSAAKLSQCPVDTGTEVAFCGRSNAGKSSSINYITGQKKLARTSKTPGRTQLINFFSVSDTFRLVDLPGYGYAKVPAAIKRDWHENIDAYLQNRQSLQGLILVMDIRHPLKDFDLMMLEWAAEAQLPIHILLTKADKLKRGAQQNALLKVQRFIKNSGNQQATLQTFSATNGLGNKTLIRQIEYWAEKEKDET